jgi:hypothetical protein
MYVIYKMVPLVVNRGVEVKIRKCCQVPVDYAERPMLNMDVLYLSQDECGGGIILIS